MYQSYGSDRRYHLELTYSVLSAHQYLRKDPADIRIVLVADEANLRPDLPVENMVVSAETIHGWQMNGTYNHAMQINGLRHIVRHYAAPAVLIDSDTVLREHPARMFDRVAPGHTLMHISEAPLGTLAAWPEIAQLATTLGGSAAGVPITPDAVMYNAGVMGVHPQDVTLLDRAMAATEAMRQQSDLFFCNQIAVSRVFTDHSKLSTCEDVVYHYWGGPRHYYHSQIARIYPAVMNGGGIASADAPLPPLRELPRPDLRHRLLGRLKRIQRSAPMVYAHAYVCASSALAVQTTNPDMANAWAAMAVDSLVYGLPDGPRAHASDFAGFAPDRLPSHSWLEASVKRRWMQYWSGEIGPAAT
ncbi:MAG: hypothetical protein J0L76_11565 [Rhodobacterales bacterium]|nr:hypothetical protein [Rhodobacterales bacterium]